MFTLSPRRLRLLLLVLACILLTSACKTLSTPPSVEPTSPEVRCKQPEVRDVPAAPRADRWVEWEPPLPGEQQGKARLSKAAAEWVNAVLGVAGRLRGFREVEHECLDALEDRGLITQ